MANCQIGLSAVIFEVLIPLPDARFRYRIRTSDRHPGPAGDAGRTPFRCRRIRADPASAAHPVRGEFIKSRSNRCLVQPATVLLPAIRGKTYRRSRATSIWQAALYSRVRPVLVKILLKLAQLRLQVCGCPE